MSRKRTQTTRAPNRIHLISHARPATRDMARFGFGGVVEYLAFIRAHLSRDYRITCHKKLLTAVEDESRGGRRDDAARVRDLQAAIDDPGTLAIVALNGGTYFSRILPDLDFSALARRHSALWVLGFSEMTNLVNIVASYRGGRGVYWLCPNFLAWVVRPIEEAREAFGRFWRDLPGFLNTHRAACSEVPIEGRVAVGRPTDGPARLVGGCISVLCANVAGPLARRVRVDGRWLLIEDIDEAVYRVDRLLATLKLAGWFERIAGVLVGDFHMKHSRTGSQIDDIVALLKMHLPRKRQLPVLVTERVGHTWPMAAAEINRPYRLEVRGRKFRLC